MRVKIIKPKSSVQLEIKKVCAYVRVSTDSLEQEDSLENQTSYFKDYIQNNPGWEFTGIYSDQGISGFKEKRPGVVVAFLTSRYTMDAKSPDAHKYPAQRAELLGAIRLPNNAFKANAGTSVVSDINFLQKRDRPIDIEPDWVHLGQTADGFAINSYFADNPKMVLGRMTSKSTQYGRQKFTVAPHPDRELADLLHEAVQNIGVQYESALVEDTGLDEIPDAGGGKAAEKSKREIQQQARSKLYIGLHCLRSSEM